MLNGGLGLSKPSMWPDLQEQLLLPPTPVELTTPLPTGKDATPRDNSSTFLLQNNTPDLHGANSATLPPGIGGIAPPTVSVRYGPPREGRCNNILGSNIKSFQPRLILVLLLTSCPSKISSKTNRIAPLNAPLTTKGTTHTTWALQLNSSFKHTSSNNPKLGRTSDTTETPSMLSSSGNLSSSNLPSPN